MVDHDENHLSSRLTEPELLVERQGSSGGFLKGVFSSAAIKCMSPLRRSAERLRLELSPWQQDRHHSCARRPRHCEAWQLQWRQLVRPL